MNDLLESQETEINSNSNIGFFVNIPINLDLLNNNENRFLERKNEFVNCLLTIMDNKYAFIKVLLKAWSDLYRKLVDFKNQSGTEINRLQGDILARDDEINTLSNQLESANNRIHEYEGEINQLVSEQRDQERRLRETTEHLEYALSQLSQERANNNNN